MPYLYQHIRLDTGKIFYIGIGKNNVLKDGHKYARAYSKSGRNNFWNKIVNKTEYKVEIILEDENYTFIKIKEKELIKLYGRRDLGLGELTNLTDGGEGTINLSKTSVDKKKGKLGLQFKKICIDFQTGLEYESLKEACSLNKINYGAQLSAIQRNYRTAQFKWKNQI